MQEPNLWLASRMATSALWLWAGGKRRLKWLFFYLSWQRLDRQQTCEGLHGCRSYYWSHECPLPAVSRWPCTWTSPHIAPWLWGVREKHWLWRGTRLRAMFISQGWLL